MDIKEAKYVLAIAQYKSINKAAKALYISQPSLSKYLQNLEYRMGVKLFERMQNKYIPTYTGKRYITYAKKMIQIDNEWLNELNDIKNLKKGHLNLAVPVVLSSCLLPKTIALFHQKFPDIDINIYEMSHSVEKSLEDQTDIDAVIYNVANFPKELDYEILGYSEITMVVHKDNPLVSKAVSKPEFKYKWVDIDLVKNENFILLYDGQTTAKLLKDFFEENYFTPNVCMRTRSSEVAIMMAIQKSGLTFANENYVKNIDIRNELVCLSTGTKPLYSTLIAAYRHDQYLSEYLKCYLEIIKNSL